MKKIVSFMIAILMVFSFAACQPTPEKPIVVNKNDGKFEAAIEQSAAPTQLFTAPQKLQAEFDEGRLHIKVDASIETPQTNTFPVFEILTKEITQEMVDSLMSVFLEGGKLLEQRSDFAVSKSEIEQEILATKKYISEKQSEKPAGQITQELLDDAIDVANKNLKELEKMYKTAPETVTVKGKSTKFETKIVDGEENLMPITGIIQTPSGKSAYLSIVKQIAPDYVNQYIMYMRYRASKVMGKDMPFSQIEGMKMTPKQAEQAALEYLAKLGITDMALSYSGAGYAEGSKPNVKAFNANDKCYILYFTKNYNGAHINAAKNPEKDYEGSVSRDEVEPKIPKDYIHPILRENMQVSVHDSGVCEIIWSNPSKIGKVINENVALLPFEKIEEIMQSNIARNNQLQKMDKAIIARKINIYRIVLGYAEVRIKGRPTETMAIPVWDFYGYETHGYEKTQPGGYILDENNEIFLGDECVSYLTINAIDGSVIDRELGY